jgi:hypothetical protein
MSYGSSTGAAQKKLIEMARGGGDSNCCHPPPNPERPTSEQWAETLRANGGKVPKAKAGTTIDQWSQAIAQSAGKIPQYSGRG